MGKLTERQRIRKSRRLRESRKDRMLSDPKYAERQRQLRKNYYVENKAEIKRKATRRFDENRLRVEEEEERRLESERAKSGWIMW